jgi:AbrB family looped-hinge helix DNA binding protein
MNRFVTRISSKGQLVIPADVRKQLGLESGDQIEFVVYDNRTMIAEKIQPTAFEQAMALLQAGPKQLPLTSPELLQAIRQARKELEREWEEDTTSEY